MKTKFAHVVFNVEPANLSFYKELFRYLGWNTLYDDAAYLGVGDGHADVWFQSGTNGSVNDHDGPGFNHLAAGAQSQADVDAVATYLRERNVELLYGTPCHRPEHAESEAHTYYSAMFESPDKILLEVVYTGPKQGD